ncbi:MAG: hypothetical protein IPL03_04260 [Sterolibacteriaceae bacterium]|nr:hypothetical protein [Candidatus Methylophosphatis haderslevensis]
MYWSTNCLAVEGGAEPGTGAVGALGGAGGGGAAGAGAEGLGWLVVPQPASNNAQSAEAAAARREMNISTPDA